MVEPVTKCDIWKGPNAMGQHGSIVLQAQQSTNNTEQTTLAMGYDTNQLELPWSPSHGRQPGD